MSGTLGVTGTLSSGSIESTGNVSAGGSVAAGFSWGGVSRSKINSPSDGVISISNAAVSDFSRLQFGGTTSSFPSLKRSTVVLIARLADDSADAELQSLRISTNNAATFHTSRATLTNGAGVGAGTILTAPAAGNPTKWIGIDDNGTTRYIPAW